MADIAALKQVHIMICAVTTLYHTINLYFVCSGRRFQALAEEKALRQAAEAKLTAALSLPELLRREKTAYGTCVTSTSPKWVPAIAACGLDFVFLDTVISLTCLNRSWALL